MLNNELLHQAAQLHEQEGKDHLVFPYETCLYKSKKYKSGEIKTESICNGIPRLVGAENIGTEENPSWTYRFKIESEQHGETQVSLTPKEISSVHMFKKSIMKKIPILFTGTKNDFEEYINKEMSSLKLMGNHPC